MTHSLVPRAGGLPTPEVLRRVATAFRQVVIDWLAGDEHQAAVARRMRELGVVESLIPPSQAGGVVFVRLADEPGEDRSFEFKLRAQGTSAEILVRYVSGQHEFGCREAVAKLAALLECEVVEVEWD